MVGPEVDEEADPGAGLEETGPEFIVLFSPFSGANDRSLRRSQFVSFTSALSRLSGLSLVLSRSRKMTRLPLYRSAKEQGSKQYSTLSDTKGSKGKPRRQTSLTFNASSPTTFHALRSRLLFSDMSHPVDAVFPNASGSANFSDISHANHPLSHPASPATLQRRQAVCSTVNFEQHLASLVPARHSRCSLTNQVRVLAGRSTLNLLRRKEAREQESMRTSYNVTNSIHSLHIFNSPIVA